MKDRNDFSPGLNTSNPDGRSETEIRGDAAEDQPERNKTFTCVICKKELPIKYIYKNNMCADCFEANKSKPKKTDDPITFVCRSCGKTLPVKDLYDHCLCSVCYELKYPNSKYEKPGSSRYWDPYSYERKNVWRYQEELFYIPELSPAREPDSDATPEQRARYYTSSSEGIYIDNRDGHLICASFSSPAFNMTASSRSDSRITYDKMHELVKKYLNEPRVKFYVDEPAVLLDLNGDNWEDWLLKYKYSDKPDKAETKKQEAVKVVESSEAESAAAEITAAHKPVKRENPAVNSAYIRESDFKGREDIKSMLIPQNVKIIEDYAFSKCVNLRRIALPDGLLSLGVYAFNECKSLESIKLPGGIKTVRRYAFAKCSNLKSVELCEGIVSIDHSAFEQCGKLSTVILPGSLKIIKGFEKTETDYDGHGRYIIETVDEAAFSKCDDIKKVCFRGTREQWEQIDIEVGNDSLRNAEIIYEYK